VLATEGSLKIIVLDVNEILIKNAMYGVAIYRTM
jgi:hypothetical protein